ncbi:glutamine-dependent NAD(+) synthetase [Hyphomonas polymorpha PS728]|uniref:Glutamine-dependent NAD(+) synthetase n=2 Tax=Hyphomonas polymorpha TaxID=74319 RepID=A0A062VFU8_9PROT|nr:glutamine-dependent NAD(+) synthetase [Hyphomonas polymorpha PS728]
MLIMSNNLRLLAAQLNPVVGDIQGNLALARQAHAQARQQGAHLLVLSEHFLLGYPAEDLVLKPVAVDLSMEAVTALAADTQDGPAILIGTPWREQGKLHNSACYLEGGALKARYDKRELPNYGVFDEKRHYQPGDGPPLIITLQGVRIGVAICEDIWFENVPRATHAAGADLLVVPNASPWRRAIQAERAAAFDRWSDLSLPYLFVNQMGGQDELVFDGASYATNSTHGARCGLIGQFETGTALVEFDPSTKQFVGLGKGCAADLEGWHAEYRAAMQGLGDYVRKNKFPGVVLGMSGGIDSAITAAIAADALGPDKVWCVMMPSKYTSEHSLEDARACARALGCRYDTINIHPGVEALDEMLGDAFAGKKADITEENIQSRLRAVTLMALSNKFGHMVVTTGNKSEMAVGYATLYGDMCGGYNALKDFYKTEVFELSKWRNTMVPKDGLAPGGEVIPERIITKPPSAELREDQKDEDSLPPYPVLDDILRGLVDLEEDVDDILARGHDPATVRRIEHLLYIAEYKRRQAPPGVKVGGKNFGRDRRYPITNRFRDN